MKCIHFSWSTYAEVISYILVVLTGIYNDADKKCCTFRLD
jgi:hypothetical protein